MNKNFLLIADHSMMKSSKYESVFKKIATQQLHVYEVRTILKDNNIIFEEEFGNVNDKPCIAFTIDNVQYFAIRVTKDVTSIPKLVNNLENTLELHEKFVEGDEVSINLEDIKSSLDGANKLVNRLSNSLKEMIQAYGESPLTNEMEKTLKDMQDYLK